MVRVIIERRRCRPDQEAALQRLLVELRAAAMCQSGYISGETLWSADDPSLCLVVSNWDSVDSWKAWESSLERREIMRKVEPLLVAPEKASVFVFAR